MHYWIRFECDFEVVSFSLLYVLWAPLSNFHLSYFHWPIVTWSYIHRYLRWPIVTHIDSLTAAVIKSTSYVVCWSPNHLCVMSDHACLSDTRIKYQYYYHGSQLCAVIPVIKTLGAMLTSLTNYSGSVWSQRVGLFYNIYYIDSPPKYKYK